MSDEAAHGLTGLLAEIADVAGVGCALRLAEAKSGAEIYVPEPDRLSPQHWLADLCGMKAATALAKHYGGSHLRLPIGPFGSRRRTWAAIRQGIQAGHTASEIVRETGVSMRTVTRHRNGHSAAERHDPRQPGLFEARRK